MQRKNNTQPQSNKAEKKNQYFVPSEPKKQSFSEKKIVALEETMNMLIQERGVLSASHTLCARLLPSSLSAASALSAKDA